MKTALLQLHVSIFLAGFTGVLGRMITLNEGLLVWYRLLITALALWIINLFAQKDYSIQPRERWKIYAVGLLVALHWVTFYGSIKYANVSVALVCFSSIGFFTALLEPLILRKRAHPVELMLGLLTIIGISIIFHFDAQYKTGILIGMVSSVFCSLFPIFNKMLLARHSPDKMLYHEMSGAFFSLTLLMPLYLYLFPSDQLWPGLSDLGWLLVLALVCTVYAMNLSMKALRKISAFTVNISFNLEPLYGIILAFIIFQENKYLSSNFYIGLGIILASVLLQTILVLRNKNAEPLTGK